MIDITTPTNVVVTFVELSEEQRQPYIALAIKVLSGLNFCTRDWQAWSYGTMTQDDFGEAACDDELIFDRAEMIYLFTHRA